MRYIAYIHDHTRTKPCERDATFYTCTCSPTVHVQPVVRSPTFVIDLYEGFVLVRVSEVHVVLPVSRRPYKNVIREPTRTRLVHVYVRVVFPEVGLH